MPSNLKKDLLALIPSLRAFALCLSQNRSDADDLVHSALIDIWASQSANMNQNLKAAAFAVLHNRFMQMDVASQQPMLRRKPECFVTSDGTFAACFGLLPRVMREAISLVEVWGFASEQAAEICGCDVETLERRIAMARRHLTHSIGLTRINVAVTQFMRCY